MGLMKDEAFRLLREKWPNATMLAEEIFAILEGDFPISIDSPVTITNQGNGPALTIDNPNGPAMQINKGGTQVNMDIQGGQITFRDKNGNPVTVGTGSTGGGGGGIPGGGGTPGGQGTNVILNNGAAIGTIATGSDTLYEVSLPTGDTVVVVVVGVDPTETIDPGTPVVVVQMANQLFGFVALWS